MLETMLMRQLSQKELLQQSPPVGDHLLPEQGWCTSQETNPNPVFMTRRSVVKIVSIELGRTSYTR